MIRALIKEKVTLTVEPGSIVEISEGQLKALGDKAVAYKEEAKEEEIKEVIETADAEVVAPKAPTSKKTSTKGKKTK